MTDNTEALPPLPGGIRLTVTERCELYDWRHESIRIALARAALARAALAQRQQVPASLPGEDKARQAFWGCYPDTGNGDMSDVWMTAYRWCRAMLSAAPALTAAPSAQAEPQVLLTDEQIDAGLREVDAAASGFGSYEPGIPVENPMMLVVMRESFRHGSERATEGYMEVSPRGVDDGAHVDVFAAVAAERDR